MRLRRAAAAVFLVCLGCGGSRQPAPPAEEPPPTATAASSAMGQVTGKLAPSVASSPSLVALESDGNVELPVRAEPAVMDQVSLVFYPSLLLAQAGQKVEFRNGEDVLHNVRVTEVAGQKPVFNVATPPYGKYEHRFERPGAYNVGCDIHSTMRADILVTTTPYTALSSQDGSFSIADVTPGAYQLTVYAGTTPAIRPVTVKAGATDLGVIH